MSGQIQLTQVENNCGHAMFHDYAKDSEGIERGCDMCDEIQKALAK